MTYEQLREQLRQRHSRKRATVLAAAAVVGVASAISLARLGPFEEARGLRNPAGPLSAAQAERVEKPIACRCSTPAEVHSPGEPVLAYASLRPTLP
jgi:hypothetical protein